MNKRNVTIGVGLLLAGTILVATGTSAFSAITVDRATSIPVAETDEDAFLSISSTASTPEDQIHVSTGESQTLQQVSNNFPSPVELTSYQITVFSSETAVTITESPSSASLSPGATAELEITCEQTESDVHVQISQIEATGDDVSTTLLDEYDFYIRCDP